MVIQQFEDEVWYGGWLRDMFLLERMGVSEHIHLHFDLLQHCHRPVPKLA